MRRFLRRLGPLQQLRLASALLIVACVLSAVGAWLRVDDGTMHRPGPGYLLSVLALGFAVTGAIWRARVAGLLVAFRARYVRTSAILSLVMGIGLALLGCVAASRGDDAQPVWQAVGEGVLTFGIGVGLSGFLTLFWAFGLDYLGERIEQRSDEEW